MAKTAKKEQATQAPTVASYSGITALSAERIKGREGVKASDIIAFIQEFAGGNPNNVGIRLVGGVDIKAELPFPWEAKKSMYHENGVKKTEKRARVMWALIYCQSNDETYTLQACDLDHKIIKAKQYHGLLDALNGGQSPSKASWGKNFVELFVIPKA
tara:strand:+ start:380 stop:853 length:474 start_codon:yes stop_codon:yes gene_type:complete